MPSTDTPRHDPFLPRPGGRTFPVEQRTALFDALMVHDTIHPDAVLPRPLHLPQTAEVFARGFWLSYQLWRDGFDRRVLARLATAVAARRGMTGADLAAFKTIRARCKQLRFAFVLFDARHRVPPRLDRATRAMGAMQDALKHGRPWMAAARAALLRLQLSRPGFALLAREAGDLRPTTPAAFRAYLEAQRATLHAGLAEATVTIHRFHAMRKTISRLVALFDCERVIDPDPVHWETARFLSTLNGMMGGLHDTLVERVGARRRDYARGRVTIPTEIASRLHTLEEALRPAG